MLGILCEKPSAAAAFAKALGGRSGTYNGQQYVITNAVGHMYEFKDPSDMVPSAVRDRVKSWDLSYLPWDESLFTWEFTKKSGITQQLQTIKSVLQNVDALVIATDVDPTGEGFGIAYEIFRELKLLRGKKIYRMYHADESAKEIQKAFVNMKPVPNLLGDAEFRKYCYRSRWDLLSMQWTRIASNYSNGLTIREGRLKSVMVKLVGDGLKAVKEYVAVPFYSNKFRDENGVIYTNPEELSYPTEAQVPQVYHGSDVVLDKKVMKATTPPKLIDLSGLSSALAPKGYGAKEVLDVYQKMYEAHICSYPRTEDKEITPEQFNDLLPFADKIAQVVGVDASLLTHRTPRKTHVKTGGAHGANRPGPNVPASLAALSQQFGACAVEIYQILAKSYLAMLAEDYQYESQTGHVKDYPGFVGQASVPKAAGWKAVYQDVMADDEDAVSRGIGTRADPYIAKGVNPKPPTPTMKWLMKQLKKYDVGTGATQTSTYSDVTNVRSKYPLLKDTKGKITMAPCGDISYVLLEDTLISDVTVTERVWKEMKDVAAGTLLMDVGLHQIQDMIRHDMEIMKRNAPKLAGLGKDVQKKMEQTGFVQKEKYSGTWNGEDVSFNREFSGHRFTDEECAKLLAGEVISFPAVSGKTGKEYTAIGKLERGTYNGHSYVGFKLDFNAGGPKIPDMWCQHKFTDDERTMLEAGKRVFIENMVSKKGNVFSAYLKYGKRDDGRMGLIMEFDK